MRFPTIFRRRIGEPPDPVPQCWLNQHASDVGPGTDWRRHLIPELGSDAVPYPGAQPERRDNLHESRLVNTNGFPSQRVVVGYLGPEGAPTLSAELYLFDETSGGWFKVPSSTEGVLVPGHLSYFDPPCLLDHSRAKRGADDESHQSGSLEVLLVVGVITPAVVEGRETPPRAVHRRRVAPSTAGEGLSLGPPAGVYTFVVGTDVSNPC